MKEQLLRRFISYVKVGTQADPNVATCPSTGGQLMLAKQLAEELQELGLSDVTLDDNGYVMATLPANTDVPTPTIGFIAHMDTATELTGFNVNPQIVENYDCTDIVLNDSQQIVLSPKQFPELLKYSGQTLITTDGNTLLGADDKAGIAEIVTAMAYLLEHPEIKHGTIKVGFTPDEEIGRGADLFDVEAFGAEYAYTMDGGPLGELQYENFNAASATVTCIGRSVHPGTAKGKMINATRIAHAFQSAMPEYETPEHTDGYEGFYHLSHIEGGVEKTTLEYIIREFDQDTFEERKQFIADVAKQIEQKFGEGTVKIEITDSYFNMRNQIEPRMEIVDRAFEAMTKVGITPIVEPIRGGTDGSRLSYMGLPTPNIFAGGENFHGKYEFVSIDTMQKAVEVIVEIAKCE
ncbi:MAG: peptidase T [Candidatus Pristimantibacillus lignocellulolyticus]|uniref:Peptidase T n=1 Tax=Candidatus Pristimantibacillus lignocellulolyticus TaxID=2994561 RepID=A0A9J6ZGI8_9BACL|nr:MAG: peptidase T [Candidatus Pristimantibacillus lignocellulolyticus]